MIRDLKQEIYIYMKRDLDIWKETFKKRSTYRWKETYMCMKRDLHIYEKRPRYVKRDL